MRVPLKVVGVLCLLMFAFPVLSVHAQQYDPKLYSEMRWRCIGPFRGGRTVAISGVPQQPNVFYMAAVNGGVWKTTDFGNTWFPIFDDETSGSVGALAVAPSDPNILYVGSGEGLQRPDLAVGDGVFKSIDAGKTWKHLGLHDAQQITAIVVDPRNPDRVFVSVQGHPYGPNVERGIFRSLDGGKTFEKVLYKDENTGGADMVMDPGNSQVLFAALWAARVAPWEIRSGESFVIPGSGLYKSTDGGATWRQITKGLPGADDPPDRIWINPSNAQTIALSSDQGAVISVNGGQTWSSWYNQPTAQFYHVTTDNRFPYWVYGAQQESGSAAVMSRSDVGELTFREWSLPGVEEYGYIAVDPRDSNILYGGRITRTNQELNE